MGGSTSKNKSQIKSREKIPLVKLPGVSELIKFGKPKFKCSRKFPAVRFLTCRPPVAVRAPPRSFLEVCARQPCRSRAALLFIDWRRENSRGLKIDCTPVKMLHFFRRETHGLEQPVGCPQRSPAAQPRCAINSTHTRSAFDHLGITHISCASLWHRQHDPHSTLSRGSVAAVPR